MQRSLPTGTQYSYRRAQLSRPRPDTHSLFSPGTNNRPTMQLAANKTVAARATAARPSSQLLPGAARPRSLVVRRFKVRCAGTSAHNARTNTPPAPAFRLLTLSCRPVHPLLSPTQEGEQADTSQQGGKAPKNPITGEPLTLVQNKDKEGYQATVLAGQSEDTSARIMGQLDGQGGRPFGGERERGRLLLAWCLISSAVAEELTHACIVLLLPHTHHINIPNTLVLLLLLPARLAPVRSLHTHNRDAGI